MTEWQKELIPILVMFLSGTVLSSLYLFGSMSEWFATKPAGAYIGYSLGWYFLTPLIFCAGWYGSIIVIIITINVWGWLFS